MTLLELHSRISEILSTGVDGSCPVYNWLRGNILPTESIEYEINGGQCSQIVIYYDEEYDG